MTIFELARESTRPSIPEETRPGMTTGRGRTGDRGVPVVDAEGRSTGVIVGDRDLRLAWRAARWLLDRAGAGTEGPRRGEPRDVDLIANDVSVFVLQDDGTVQQRLPERSAALPLDAGPSLDLDDLGAFMRHARTAQGYARRERSEIFGHHYRVATAFWNDLSARDRARLVLSARSELGKLRSEEAWWRAIAQFQRVDGELARRVARGLQQPDREGAGILDLLVRRR